MLKEIKKRIYNLKKRIYIEGKYLNDADFIIGAHIKYNINEKHKKVIIELTREKTKNKVAQTTVRSGNIVPVIDIKSKEVRKFVEDNKNIQLLIYKGKIILQVIKNTKCKVIKLQRKSKEHTINIFMDKKVVNAEQVSMFDYLKTNSSNDFIEKIKNKIISVVSLFSGAGMLDKGFVDEGGYEFKFAIDKYGKRELKDYHIQTYRENIGDHIIMKDILELQKEEVPEADLVIGGIPCVSFSALNTKNNFRNSKLDTHPLVEKYIKIVKWCNAKAFLIENVPKFLTAKGGVIFNRLKKELSEFKIIAKKIFATSLGSPQKRERVYILGLKNKEPELNVPNVSKVTTVKDAFANIDKAPQQDMFFKPTEKILERFKYIKQGGNIKDCPEYLRPKNKKFSNFCQRLNENGQAPTITHVQDDVFFHPILDRYLTVREAARLFSLPDNFIFKGSLTSIFEQIKNGVDYKVSRFLAKTIKKQMIPIL